ncbi:MAG: anti-sigma factor [Burkholderiaceae bacterium]
MDYGRPELAERLAAGYVTGTLRAGARRRFESLLPAHAGLRSAVRTWQARLMPLTAVIPPVVPPARVWTGIERWLDGAKESTASGWWNRLAVWRGLSAMASVAVLGLAVLLSIGSPVQAPIVVVMNPVAPSGGAPGAAQESIVASISGDGRALVTRPLVNVNVAADRALELWAVPAQGPTRSLGLIARSGATVLRRSDLLRDTDALAVSLEPPGGSPTGVATGPVLYVGKLRP